MPNALAAERELTIPKALLQDAFSGSGLALRLHQVGRARKSLFAKVDAFRLHDVQADVVCLATIEFLAGYGVINAYGASETECGQVGAALLELGARGVYVKYRARADLRKLARAETAPAYPIQGQAAPEDLQVLENGLAFHVRLADGISTGLFLDQRDSRALLRADCAGARVLNLFCYTGTFSIAAAAGGAASVTSVDSSATALRRLDANIALNEQERAAHRLLKSDATTWLNRAAKRPERYDWIVLDPPSFSSRGKQTFSVATEYAALAKSALGLLTRGGRLIAVTNHRQTSCASFERVLSDAATAAGRRCRFTWLPAPIDCVPHDPNLGTKTVLVTAL